MPQQQYYYFFDHTHLPWSKHFHPMEQQTSASSASEPTSPLFNRSGQRPHSPLLAVHSFIDDVTFSASDDLCDTKQHHSGKKSKSSFKSIVVKKTKCLPPEKSTKIFEGKPGQHKSLNGKLYTKYNSTVQKLPPPCAVIKVQKSLNQLDNDQPANSTLHERRRGFAVFSLPSVNDLQLSDSSGRKISYFGRKISAVSSILRKKSHTIHGSNPLSSLADSSDTEKSFSPTTKKSGATRKLACTTDKPTLGPPVITLDGVSISTFPLAALNTHTRHCFPIDERSGSLTSGVLPATPGEVKSPHSDVRTFFRGASLMNVTDIEKSVARTKESVGGLRPTSVQRLGHARWAIWQWIINKCCCRAAH